MFCTQCGAEMSAEQKFCTSCGKPGGATPGEPDPYPPGVPPPPIRRRLRRILSQKKIAGVCAGFAEYFDVDLTLMRIIWVGLLLLPPSIGLIAYIIAWIAMPSEPV